MLTTHGQDEERQDGAVMLLYRTCTLYCIVKCRYRVQERVLYRTQTTPPTRCLLRVPSSPRFCLWESTSRLLGRRTVSMQLPTDARLIPEKASSGRRRGGTEEPGGGRGRGEWTDSTLGPQGGGGSNMNRVMALCSHSLDGRAAQRCCCSPPPPPPHHSRRRRRRRRRICRTDSRILAIAPRRACDDLTVFCAPWQVPWHRSDGNALPAKAFFCAGVEGWMH